MLIFNTLTRRLEELKPRDGRRLKIFVCGPTVYDYIHIGNGRTFVFFDAAVKYLRYRGYSVFYLQNITDLDDKIINRAKETGTEPSVLARRFFEAYLTDMAKVHADAVSYYAFATDFIREIANQVRRLLRIGAAYVAKDGVYFDVSTFKDYGKLSGQKLDQVLHMVRHEMSASKRNPEDFALWKFTDKHEEGWNYKWGRGRPGWHIEDTAITEEMLGKTYDIHGGGTDLIFPHHEGEIAIMRTLSGNKKLARYWIHSGMLNISNKKMAKSEGNIINLRDAAQKYGGNNLRLFFLSAGYRSELIFDESTVHEATQNLNKIQSLYDRLMQKDSFGLSRIDVPEYRNRIVTAIDKDFDFRSGIMTLLDFANRVNTEFNDLSEDACKECLHFLLEVDSFLCILNFSSGHDKYDRIIDAVLEIREMLRKRKEFESSDKIRSMLSEAGVEIEDADAKVTWRLRQ
ncbi:MAG: cysteine--tRNA ligase [Thermoplasmataceae archaeon]|jgi:cysteinyl-tRNA synthetase